MTDKWIIDVHNYMQLQLHIAIHNSIKYIPIWISTVELWTNPTESNKIDESYLKRLLSYVSSTIKV